MELFNERIVFYGDLILTEDTVKDLRCDLVTNHLDTENNIAVISIPSTVKGQIFNKLHLQKKFIFQTTNQKKSIYLEAYRYEFHDKFQWEAILRLFAEKVIITDSYSDKSRNKSVFRAFISPSDLIFNENQLTFHASKGLLSGWNPASRNNEPEWIENVHQYQSKIGTIKLVMGFIFNEHKNHKFSKQYNILRQLIIYSEANTNLNMQEQEKIFLKELNQIIKSLSLVLVKRINSWYYEILTSDADNYPIFDKRIFNKVPSKAPLKDNRFIYGILYKKLHPTITLIKESLSKLDNTKFKLFDRILDRYLIAFTYEKIDTQIIYTLSCLDIIKNSFSSSKKDKRGFIKNLIDVCKQNNIIWLDLFPYLTEEYINESKSNDMLLNKTRADIIHHGKYPEDYRELRKEILAARALCERFIMKLLNIDYKSTCLGTLTRY